jgi:transcriptional regulator with XRE-family HTH domain
MSADFSRVLHGLMQNRRLSARAVSQLLTGKLRPTHDILRDIAPALQLDAADLFVIADLPPASAPAAREPYPAMVEIGQLVAAASFLTPSQVKLLVHSARALRDAQEDPGENPPARSDPPS